MKKIYLIVAFLLIFSVPVMAQDRMEKLILAGPRGPVTTPLAYIVEAGLLDKVAKNVELVIWKNADQLRAIIAGEQAHFVATPSVAAAKLYNKGIPIQLLNISVWGDYWIVSRDPKIKTIVDLKGEEIAMPRRRGTPDIVFTCLAQKQELNPANDFTIRYMPNYVAAMQEIVSGRVKHAFLSEPHVSTALLKTEGEKMNLLRAINIQEEWGKAYNTKSRIARAGISALPNILKHSDIVVAFQNAYKEAISWCKANPDKAGKVAAKYIPGFKARPVALGIKNGMLEFVSAGDAKPEIEKFHKALLSQDSTKIGGKLPNHSFYWSKP